MSESSRHSHHKHRRRGGLFSRFSGRKRLLLYGLCTAGVLLVLVLLYVGLTRLERSLDAVPEGAGLALTRAEEPEESEVLYYNGRKYLRRERQITLLILGIDDEEVTESLASRNTSQADFLTLAVFDPSEERCTLLQLNRDTMTDVPVPDGRGGVARLEWEQLALAHTYGNGLERSCEVTVDAVSRLLYNVEIDNYFALTMDAIPILNELVGGVTVTVEDDFTGVDETLARGKTVRLDAGNVESFVRARSSMREDATNLNRMKRQREYLSGLFEALRASLREDEDFVPHAFTALSDSLVSDCTLTELSLYAERFSVYELSEIVTPEGEAVKGEKYMEFYVDEKALQELVLRIFYRPVD